MKTAGTWSFYSPDSGQFLGRTYSGSAQSLAANTPIGTVAIEGDFDQATERVDVETGKIVTHRPPAPEDTLHSTWTWHDVLRRHVPVLKFEGQRLDLVARIGARIVALEGATDRALRDLILGGPPGPSRDRLQLIEDQVRPLRGAIDAANAAESPAELAAIDLQVFAADP